MDRKKRIESILLKNFKEWEIKVNDISIQHKGHNSFKGNEESHFSIILDSKNKRKESRLSIHRKVNNLLNSEFNSGLHALEIKIIS